MRIDELRKKFLNFFEKNGHTIVPSSSLIPDDPSVLLTTAGMQQFKPYYSELDPEITVHPSIGKPVGKNAASVQKSFRTSDIDEVGDDSHLTFFEMLGNFSFGYKPGLARAGTAKGEPRSPKGGYFKKEAIQYAYEFLKEIGLPIDFVTVFGGDGEVAADIESEQIWRELGVKKIEKRGREDNFWGPTGSEGPCGPTTEIYINGIEVWNIVFNQYYCKSDRKLEPLKQNGVDTGMGLERLAMVLQNKKNIFETDLFAPLIEPFSMLPSDVSGIHQRIIVDHARASSFLITDGVRPSNKEAGYILRRLLRRVFIYELIYRLSPHLLNGIIHNIAYIYGGFYPEIREKQDTILDEFKRERDIFGKTIKRGLDELKKRYPGPQVQVVNQGNPFIVNQQVGKEAADIHQTYGLPVEFIREYLKHNFYKFDEKEFSEEAKKAFKKHQEISRRGTEKKFGGHGLLLDTGELKAANEEELKIVTRLHTATHMLQQALREVLGLDVHQAGSDITVERTRFDFTYPRKLAPEEVKRVEDLVNQKIKEDLPMQKKVLPKAEAEKTGALYFFKEKYPDPVNVYFIGKSLDNAWSKEFCGGPHITHTGEIGRFKIAKEEAVGAGVRRIRGVVE